MFITSFPSSSLSLLGLFFASFIDAQRTITRDACAIARSVDNSCTARFSIDRAKTGLDTTWTTPPVITYDGVDVVRCFCCLEEAPLTPVWSSCAAQIETASPEKDQFLENLEDCLGFEECRVKTATPAACHSMSDWVMECSSHVKPETMSSSETFSRMEECLCPTSAPGAFNNAHEACGNWAWIHNPEYGSSMQFIAPYWCNSNLDTTIYSATATSSVSFKEVSSTAFASTSLPSTSNPSVPTSTMNSAIPSNTVVSQAANSSGQPNTSIVVVIAVVVIVFMMVGGIAIWSSVKRPRDDHGIPI
ncbi:hypothetical protein CCHR01_10059 [Colletotrichum chrysophilum]|uniref:Integral membrane protein n=1 Tax=Colletotrichum chrysophilum TaxID=1836956 RepID=A0AAD9AI38_9PEZI|nr:hypothetical protein CCHR01_10059 [Colletotrichum chrysophilum]